MTPGRCVGIGVVSALLGLLVTTTVNSDEPEPAHLVWNLLGVGLLIGGVVLVLVGVAGVRARRR